MTLPSLDFSSVHPLIGGSVGGPGGPADLPVLQSSALISFEFLTLGGLVEGFPQEAFTRLLFTVFGARRQLSIPLQEWGNRQS